MNVASKDLASMKVALVQGGIGSERDVSRVTGAAFAEALTQLGLNYVVVDAAENLPVRLLEERPDVALLALHGKFGEDGTVQGICEYLKIPYSGCGLMASAVCMDKAFTKKVLAHEGVPTPKYKLLDLSKEPLPNKAPLDFPLVVKPSRDGSSMGTSLVYEEAGFVPAIERARPYDHFVVVEEMIQGQEITIPFLRGRTLTSIEIVPKVDFYNYENKYTKGKTEYFLPARVSQEVIQQCETYALKAIEVLGLRSYGRIDFFVDREKRPFLLEINTLPGCTPTSLLPKSAQHEGIEFPELIRALVEDATLDYLQLK